MKILIFSTAYFPYVGGAEVAVQRIADFINDKEDIDRMEFHMITAKIDKKKIDKEFPKRGDDGSVSDGSVYRIYHVGFGWGTLDKIILAIWGARKALKLNKMHNYDAIWSIMASQASIAASFFKIFSGKKLILTLQEGDEEEHLKRYVFGNNFLYKLLIRPWHRLVFKKADIVTVISEHLKKRAIKNGVEPSKIRVIPNAVEIPLFLRNFYKQEPEITRKTLNIKEDEKVIITVSRLVRKNGIEDLIKAMKYVGAKLIICGIGEDESKLKNLAKDLEIENKVLFEGNIEHEKIPQYLWLSDVFCRPSLSEGLGNVFLEAMTAGLPVVATPVGGIPDFLKDGETGWFCKVKNPKSIAEKVKYILDSKNKEEVERVKENAEKLVREKYNWALVVKQMKEVFYKLNPR